MAAAHEGPTDPFDRPLSRTTAPGGAHSSTRSSPRSAPPTAGRYAAALPEFFDAVRVRAANTGADLRWLPATAREFREVLFTAAATAYQEHAIAVTYHPAIDGVEFRQLRAPGRAPTAKPSARPATA